MHGTPPVRSTYKTAEELGFSQEEFDALAWFVDEYDAGRIPDAKITSNIYPNLLYHAYPADTMKPPDAFYMPYISIKHECKTAGCIFGWIAHRVEHTSITALPRPIRKLCESNDDTIKAVHARDATVRVLRGEPAWP